MSKHDRRKTTTPEIELDEYQDEQSEEARRVQQIIDELDSPDDFNEGP